ncbi:MAG: hypothetical protein KY396_00440 [Actinobacteria bacterium]|nr:hypothetical protein [Actinomycetota bacterium]
MAAGAAIFASTGTLSHDESILAQILVHLFAKEQQPPRAPALVAAPLEGAGEAAENLDLALAGRTVDE